MHGNCLLQQLFPNRYKQNSDSVKKMHRSVTNKDVIDYSTGARKRDIQLRKEEDIEYRNGILQHSSGDTSFKIQNKNGIKEPQHTQEKEFSDVFSAHGSYTLDLQRCHTLTRKDGARRKRSLISQMNRNRISEERLTASFNISKYLSSVILTSSPGPFPAFQCCTLKHRKLEMGLGMRVTQHYIIHIIIKFMILYST